MFDRYAVVGHFYDFTSNLYSGKSIQRCKVAHLDLLRPGDKVLFAGVGHGRDALYAARRGADVTVVDLSKTMLMKFSRVMAADGNAVVVRQVHSDIMAFDEPERYDMVVANFFLNVFNRERVSKVLAHLITQAKPGGKVVVGDFAHPHGNALARMAKTLYWYIAVIFFWLIAGNAVHDIYDYPALMDKLGLKVDGKKYFPIFGMDFYWSVLGRKPG
jgi:demethylmenaquinone methyltransferase/2-methoxy-6-polyprenyl-1,4-benzoquinol methylase